MKSTSGEDLGRLKARAFTKKECAGLVRRFHGLSRSARARPDFNLLQAAYLWMLAPMSLWPFDMAGWLNLLLTRIERGRRAPPETEFLVELLGPPPSLPEQEQVAAHEHDSRHGRYEKLISAPHKFDLKEALMARDPAFRADWRRLKTTYRAGRYRDRHGIIRRRMLKERGFRSEGWDFRWETEDDRFRIAFEAFCHKWVLYGMAGDRPLLQKLSVNMTPLGTMIFIPRYWSFDSKRDIRWAAVLDLHRSRPVRRQGAKLTANQLARRQEALRALALWEQAGEDGLKGEMRSLRVMRTLGWDARTDERQLRRLLDTVRRPARAGKRGRGTL